MIMVMASEIVALEHIRMRRRDGWSLFDCRCEVRLCATMRGMTVDLPLESWDDVVLALSAIWDGLPHGQGAIE
jgi:hypothetical protein